MKPDKTYKFILVQDGIEVACVESSDRDRAFKEINHYAWIYSQDGEVEIREKK